MTELTAIESVGKLTHLLETVETKRQLQTDQQFELMKVALAQSDKVGTALDKLGESNDKIAFLNQKVADQSEAILTLKSKLQVLEREAPLEDQSQSLKRKRKERFQGDVNVFDEKLHDKETQKQIMLELVEHKDAYQLGVSKQGLEKVLKFIGKSTDEITAKCALCKSNMSRLSMALSEISRWHARQDGLGSVD